MAHLHGDRRVVTGDDLDGDPERGEPRQRCRRAHLRTIGEHEEAFEREVALVRRVEVTACREAGGDGDDPAALMVETVEHRARRGGHGAAARQHRFGRALGDERRIAARAIAHHHRHHASLVVEWERRDSLDVGLGPARRVGGFPQGDVERVAADRAGAGNGCFGALQAEHERPIRRRAVRSDGAVETDAPLGERARLVGEEDLDVAEVLDAHEALHEHLALREPARASGEARGDDGGQQLGRDADGDRQREQHGIHDRPLQHEVDGEDRHREHGSHAHEQRRELA
jgi:hypothetical protein